MQTGGMLWLRLSVFSGLSELLPCENRKTMQWKGKENHEKRAIILLVLALIAMVLASCGCRHKNTHLENVLEATCLQEGYSGNEVCDECG